MARPSEGWKLRKRGGRYFVRFTVAGERVELATGARDPEEAARCAAKLYSEHQLSAPARRLKVLTPELALVEIAATWIADIDGELDPATLETFLIYARHFQAFFGSMSGITDASCAQYSRERLRKVKRQTVRKELSALRRFVRWCVQQGVLSREPTIPSPPPRATGTAYFKRRRSNATVITPAEALAIIGAVPEWSRKPGGEPFPVRARIRFEWETALRPKTIDNLNVPEHYTRGAATLIITDEIDKARFGREIPLTAGARAAIDSVCPDVGVIFGRHHCRDRLTAAARAVLPPEKAATFTPYDLRHSRATEWAESGNLVGVAFLLGHKHISTTNRYTRPNEAAARRVLGVKDSATLRWTFSAAA